MLWDILSDFRLALIPTKDSYLGWSVVFGENMDFSWINDTFKNLNIDNLATYLKDETSYTNWLNDFYSLWIKDAGIETVLESVLVPNQNNEFIQFNDIYLDENIDNELKEILTSLGGKIKEQLLNKDIVAFNDYFNNQSSKVKTNAIC